MSTSYDVCVVGAGIMGSATARHLAKLGQKTLLLEQFPLPHWRGSSHGQTRVCRSTYLEPYYIKMAEDAKKMWIEIEKEAGEELLHKNVGKLMVEEPPFNNIRHQAQLLENNNINHEILSSKELKDKFPEIYFPGYSGLLEQTAGVLMADKCLKNLQKQFIVYGGTLQDGHMALDIQPDMNGVTIKSCKATFRVKKLILTAGPWTNKILEPLRTKLPLKGDQHQFSLILKCVIASPMDRVYQVYKVPVLYWKINKSDIYSIHSGFPCFFDGSDSCGLQVYAIPSLEYPGLIKLSPTVTTSDLFTDPEARDTEQSDVDRFIAATSQYVKEHFPYLDYRQPTIREMCLCTASPDRDFIIDRHPRFENIVIGAGFSCHGFKHAPVVGKILSELALNQSPSYDISHFKVSKFIAEKPKSSL